MSAFKKPIVIKIGGSTLGSQDTTIEDIVTLQKEGLSIVVVHGGGQVISKWLSQMDITTNFRKGLRVTDEKSLEVVTAVLSGLVNKELVSAIHSFGGKAIGVSGVDGGLIQARIEDPELGYVGEVIKINTALLRTILANDYIPVVAPVSLASPEEMAKGIKLLNVNADIVAGELAKALEAEKLIFLTDVSGVYSGSGELITYLTSIQAEELLASGVTQAGMRVKVEACLRALTVVPLTRIIDGRVPHILLKEIKEEAGGTTIVRG